VMVDISHSHVDRPTRRRSGHGTRVRGARKPGRGAVDLGSVVTPVVIFGVGNRGALVVLGSLCPAPAVLGWARLRMLDRTLSVRTYEIELLRSGPYAARAAGRHDRAAGPGGAVGCASEPMSTRSYWVVPTTRSM
jgi:hypothetical protein